MASTPPRSISTFRSASPSSDLDSYDGHSQDSFIDQASVVDAESLAQSVDSTWGLGPVTKKQLLEDILDRGGLHQVQVAELIKEKPDFYDNSAAFPNRKSKTKNTVQYWKREPASYSKVLKEFGLEDKALRVSIQSPSKSKPAPTKKRKSTPARKAKPSSTTPTTTPTRQASSSRLRSPPPTFAAARPPPQADPATMSENTITSALRLKAAAQNNIRTANTDMPEQNGGLVTINTLTEIPYNGCLRVAFSLSMNADLRYAFDETKDWYRTYVHGLNEVLLLYPSQPYSELFAPENYERGRKHAGEDKKDDHARHVQAEKLQRNAVLAAAERQCGVICFKFDRDIILDNSILSPNSANNAISVRVVPEVFSDDTAGDNGKVFFTIIVHDDDPPRIDAPKPPPSDNQLSGLLKKMNLKKKNGAP